MPLFPTLASIQDRQVGKEWRSFFFFFAFFLWMEVARLDGTLIVLCSLIQMAPCITDSSNNKETVCQESKKASLFHLIIANGTHFGARSGVYWVDGKHYTILICRTASWTVTYNTVMHQRKLLTALFWTKLMITETLWNVPTYKTDENKLLVLALKDVTSGFLLLVRIFYLCCFLLRGF